MKSYLAKLEEQFSEVVTLEKFGGSNEMDKQHQTSFFISWT